MLAGYEVWSRFESYGLSVAEYGALSRRLDALFEDAELYIKDLNLRGAEVLSDIELDLTIAYFTRTDDDKRLTPWFMHECAVIREIKSPLYQSHETIAKLIEQIFDPQTDDVVIYVIRKLEYILRTLSVLNDSVDENACLICLLLIDICILDIIKMINTLRIGAGLRPLKVGGLD